MKDPANVFSYSCSCLSTLTLTSHPFGIHFSSFQNLIPPLNNSRNFSLKIQQYTPNNFLYIWSSFYSLFCRVSGFSSFSSVPVGLMTTIHLVSLLGFTITICRSCFSAKMLSVVQGIVFSCLLVPITIIFNNFRAGQQTK